MDDSMIGATQALDFSDYGDETDEQESDRPVGYLNVPCQKGFSGKLFPLHQGDNVIGRGESCDICIPLKGLSREHACIEVKGEAHFIYDKGSRNRTRRNKHFLAASVRYELKDRDVLTFGDVDCHYQVGEQQEGDETGSETGSESEFQTAPVAEELDETSHISDSTKSKLLGDDDDDEGAESDASSDILQPTQPFSNVSNTQSMLGRNKTQAGDTTHVTVMETPAPSKSKRFTDNLTLPESDGETTDDEAVAGLPATMVVADSQDDGELDSKSVLIGAATQAYVGESDVTTDDDSSPRKKSLLMQPTQVYNDSDMSTCSEESPQKSSRKRSLLAAATQAYLTDEEPSPKKKKPVVAKAVEQTMAYTMAEGIEPTQAYDMEDKEEEQEKKPSGKKTIAQTVAYTMAAGIEPTQAYDMGAEEEEEKQEEEDKSESVLYEPTQAYRGAVGSDEEDKEEEEKRNMLCQATQAYTGNKEKRDEDQEDDVESDTSEEFVLEGDTENEDEDEDASRIMAAPTLACDMEEDETAGDKHKPQGGDEATQVFDHSSKENQEETQVVTDDATQMIDNNNSKKPKTDPSDQAETQVFNGDATQVFDETGGTRKRSGGPATDETQVLNEDATQVFDEDKKCSRSETETQVVSEEATQVFTDTGEKEIKQDNRHDATQVFNETKKTSGNQDRSSDEATQVFDHVTEPDAVEPDENSKIEAAEGEEEPEFDINAMSTFAAPVEEDEDTEGDAEADVEVPSEEGTQVFEETEATVSDKEQPVKMSVASKSNLKHKNKKNNFSQEDATQVFDEDQTAPVSGPDETVAIQEDATVAVSEDDIDDTVRNTTRGKGRVSRKVTDKKQILNVSEEATQVFDEDQTAPIAETDETVAIQEEPTVAVPEDAMDDDVKTTTRGKGRASKKAAKKRAKNVAEEATQLFPDNTIAVNEVDPTVAITEDATLAISDETVKTDKVENEKKTSRSKRKTKAEMSRATEKTEEETQVIQEATIAISEIDAEETEIKQSVKSKRQSRRTVKEKTQDNGEDEKVDNDAVSVVDTLTVAEVEEETKISRKAGRRGVSKTVKTGQTVDDKRDSSESLKAGKEDETENKTATESKVEIKSGKRVRSSMAPEESKIMEEEKSGRSTRTSRRQKDKNESDVQEETKVSSRKSSRKSAKNEEAEEVAGTAVGKKAETNMESDSAGPSKVIEPETQMYCEEKDTDEAATQRYGEEEETQRYERDEDDSTPDIAELGLVDDDEDESLVIPKPPLVPIPSRSPYKSALASPEKRKEKSPSPKRVKFVSQSSDTSSEGSTRPSRGKKQQQTGDRGKASQRKSARTTRGSKQDADEEADSVPQETVTAPTRPSRGRKSKTSSDVNTDTAPREPVAAASDEKQESRRSSRAKTSKKTVDSAGDSVAEVMKDSVECGDTVTKVEPELDTSQVATTEVKGGKKATRDRARGKKEENVDSVNKGVTSEPDQASTAEVKADNKVTRTKARGKKNEKVVSEVKVETKEETKQSVPEEVKGSNRATRSKIRGKKEESLDSVDTETKAETEVENKQTPAEVKAGNKSTRSKGRSKKIETATEVQEKDESVVNKRTRGTAKTNGSDETSADINTSENNEPCESGKQTKSDSVGDKKATRGRTKNVENSNNQGVKTETSDTTENSGSKRTRTRGGTVGARETADIEAESMTTDTIVSASSGRKGGRQSSKGSAQEVTVKATEESKPARAARGKRKDTAEEEEALESSATQAKRQKTKEARKTSVPSAASVKGKALEPETPKSHGKRVSALGTPKGGATKDLDSSLVNSPTLRKSTVSADKPRVMFTGVVDEQGEKIVKDLGGELVTSVYDCTHLVTDQIRRTVKFLCCLSRGVPIVTPQWLVSSRGSGFFSDPSPFIVRDDASEKKFRCCLRSSLAKASEKQLLTGYKVHVTKSVKPEPAHMKDIIQCAGSQYLGTMPKAASPDTVVISCPDDKPQCEAAIKAGIPVVSAEFVLTGVLRQEVDTNSFMLFSSSNGNKRSATGPATETAAKRRKR